MSELIAEARVLVTPDTTAFRSLLTAQVTSAASGVVVPIAVAPVVTGTASTAAAAAAQKELATAATASTVALERQQAAQLATAATQREAQLLARGGVVLATQEERALASVAAQQRAGALAAKASAAAQTQEAAARKANAAAAAAQARTLGGLTRGAGSAALSLVGLRGATLASTGPFLAGAAAIVTFVASLRTAAGLESSLNTFRVTADATAEEMERISDVARELGTDLTLPGVTAGRAADALAQLSRAGLSVEDSIGGVRGTLQLATAAAIDNETAVVLVANALNAFRLAGDDAGRVADLLAASSKQSQGSIEDMGLALQQAAAAAAQAGISVEDTIAILTQLGRAGLRGSDAGTSLRTAILRIINPSKQAKVALEGLGVELRDLQGNIRPEVFAEIASQAARLGPAQRDATIALIGGQDAFRAISILGRDGAQGLNEMRDATQEAGAAAELASARTEGLAGAFENLKNQGEGVGLALGDALKGPLTDFVNILGDGVGNINTFVQFLDRLGDSSEETGTKVEIAARQFQELVEESGRINFAVAVRGEDAGDRLLEKQARLNEELEETQSAALRARDGVEGYRATVQEAATAVEGLVNRIDESQDRFARPLPTPELPDAGPVAIGPTARLNAAAQLAASRDDLRDLERIQQVQLDNARRAFENSKGNVQQRTQLFNQMAAAEAALNSTRRQIAARQEADARSVAADIERSRREADAAFLNSLGGQESAQQNRVAAAAQTAALQDDINQTRALRQLYLAQRQAILARVQDVQTRREAVEQVTKKIVQEEGRIKDLIRQQTEAQAQARQEALDATAQNLSLRTQIAEARGNDDQILTALNAEIANQRKRIAAAKKAKDGVLQEQLALEQLLAQRRELREKVEEDSGGGKSLAEFLTENTSLFGQLASSGGLTGVDPFSGFDFSSSIVAATTKMQQAVKQQQAAAPAQQNRLPDAIDRLIAALERNTESKSGNDVTGGVITNGGMTYANITGQRGKALGDFWQAKQARQLEEARFDGGAAT